MSDPIGAAHSYRWKAEQEMLTLRAAIRRMVLVVDAADALCHNMSVEEYGKRLVLLHQAVDAWRLSK